MRSVIYMFIVFIGLGIVLCSGILSFLAQTSVLIFAGVSVVAVLLVAFIKLGSPFATKRRIEK